MQQDDPRFAESIAEDLVLVELTVALTGCQPTSGSSTKCACLPFGKVAEPSPRGRFSAFEPLEITSLLPVASVQARSCQRGRKQTFGPTAHAGRSTQSRYRQNPF